MHKPLRKLAREFLRCVFGLLIFGQAQGSFAADCWTNADLSALENTKVNAIVYVWSPRMALSVLHAHEVAKQARIAGLLFIPLVDARVPEDEWRSALQAAADSNVSQPDLALDLQSSRSMCASQLIALDAYQHFPSVFMLRFGQLHLDKWTGAMNVDSWASAFQAGLKRRTLNGAVTPALLPQDLPVLPTMPISASTAANSGAGAKVSDSKECVAANQFIALPPELAGRGDDQAVALGAYERISPDGRFVLRSYSGKNLSAVSLIELPAPSPQPNQLDASVLAISQTPLSNEAFPVQGSWRYVVDTDGQHYTFNDLLVRQKQATPRFKGGMSGFYAAAAEVGSTYPAKSAGPVQIRSLSWPNVGGDSDTVGEGMLTARTITVDGEQSRVLADSGRSNLCLSRSGIDGSLYSLPMISVDGQHFAALPQRPVNNVATMRIFGFGTDGKQCLPERQFTSPTGKVTFGFTPQDFANAGQKQPPDLTYEYRGQTWWYASHAAKAFNLAPWEERPINATEKYRQKIIASAFPGVTRDGRVIYAATWQLCRGADCSDQAGYIVSDPYQSNAYQQYLLTRGSQSNAAPKAKSCITKSDVLRERSDFANFHGIAAR